MYVCMYVCMCVCVCVCVSPMAFFMISLVVHLAANKKVYEVLFYAPYVAILC